MTRAEPPRARGTSVRGGLVPPTRAARVTPSTEATQASSARQSRPPQPLPPVERTQAGQGSSANPTAESVDANQFQRMQVMLVRAVELQALAGGLNVEQPLREASAEEMLDRCDTLLRAARETVRERLRGYAALQANVRGVTESMRQLQSLVAELDAERAGFGLRLARQEASALAPEPMASFGLRVARVTFATAIGSLVGGPLVALALGDPILSKMIEGAIGGLVGGIGAEGVEWATSSHENRIRAREITGDSDS